MNWQDHWQQTISLVPKDIDVDVGDIVTIQAIHNSVKINVFISKIHKSNQIKKRSRDDIAVAIKTMQRNHTIDDDNSILISNTNEVDSQQQQQCTCGWHMLCGPERFQMMCDSNYGMIWQQAIDAMLIKLQDNNCITLTTSSSETTYDNHNTYSSLRNIILDVADGSMLGLSTALKVNQYPTTLNESICIVSKENKLFSRIFFDQLIQANEVQDKIITWDGISWYDIFNHAYNNTSSDMIDQEANDDEANNDEANDDESNDDDDEDIIDSIYMNKLNNKIMAVISECFYYQLRALPIWQLLSFYYYRSSLYRDNLLHPLCITIPYQAVLKAAAVELVHLHKSHGSVERFTY